MVYCGKARRGINPPLESERCCSCAARGIFIGNNDRGNDNVLSTRHLRVDERQDGDDAYDDTDATIAREARDPRLLDATVVEINNMLFDWVLNFGAIRSYFLGGTAKYITPQGGKISTALGPKS